MDPNARLPHPGHRACASPVLRTETPYAAPHPKQVESCPESLPKHYQSPFSRDLLRRMMRSRALREHGDPNRRTSPVLSHWVENLHPSIRAEAQGLVDRGRLPLHDHAHALNSSQAFAMNLFMPLRIGSTSALQAFLTAALDRAVTVSGVELEYFGSGDLLAEIPGPKPGPQDRLTYADVAVHLRDDADQRGLLLIEVKLSESGFTQCGGANSRGNRDRAPCLDAGVFFAQPDRCYLRRPYRATRDRRYWEVFARDQPDLRAAFPGADTNGPCPFVADWQQPMRNHALALASEQAGLVDFWALALVHHDDNPDVIPGWDSYTNAVASSSSIFRWPASALIPAIGASCPDAQPPLDRWLSERYLLGVSS